VGDDLLTKLEILVLVQKGAWTPQKAEAWAKRCGLPPFAGKPDAASYDPREELNWTLCMALIWIASGDLAEVREAWPEWLSGQRVWHEFVDGGKRWWSLGPPQRREDYSRWEGYEVDPRTAVKGLWRALETGEIVVTGISKSEGVRRVIRPEEWFDLKVDRSRAAVHFYLEGVHHDNGGRWEEAFSKVLLPVREVLRNFPSKDAAASETLGSDDEARQLIRKILGENDGYISQEMGAEMVRRKYSGFRKKRAMELVKEATGNDKPGPRGPRKKLRG